MRRIIDITVTVSEAPESKYHVSGRELAETHLRASEELIDVEATANALVAAIARMLASPAPRERDEAVAEAFAQIAAREPEAVPA